MCRCRGRAATSGERAAPRNSLTPAIASGRRCTPARRLCIEKDMAEIAGRTTPQPGAPAESAPTRRMVPAWATPTASVLGVLLIWQLLGPTINPVFGSYPSEIALAFVDLVRTGKLW